MAQVTGSVKNSRISVQDSFVGIIFSFHAAEVRVSKTKSFLSQGKNWSHLRGQQVEVGISLFGLTAI